MLQQFVQDVRHGARTLRASLLVSIVIVLTLGIGIGLLTAIFSIVNAAVLRPLPYDDARRLVAVSEAHPREYSAFSTMSPAAFAALRERSRSFEAVAAYDQTSGNVGVAGSTESLSGAEVSAGLFALLRVAPVRGRVFTSDEASADARVIVISHELWITRFGASESVIGSTIRLDGGQYTVIGVMAAGFNFPQRQQFWRPLVNRPNSAEWLDRSLAVAARLRDGVTLQAARAEVAMIGVAFAREHPATQDGWTMQVRSEILERTAIPGPLPWMVLAAGLFMLLIACANVTTVLLARAASRRGEMAVRAALGASRRRLVAQHLTETLLLAVAGGVVGVLIATWTIDIAWASLPTQHVPSWLDFGVDWRVLAFTVGVALVALLVVGVGPALTATRVKLSDPLKLGAMGETASRKELRASRVLVVVEVAAAFILFAGSALMVQSFRKLRDFNFGIRADRVLSARPSLSRTTYAIPARRDAYFAEAAGRVRQIPGVRAVAMRGDLDSLRGAAWTMDSAAARRERGAIIARGADPSVPAIPERWSVRRYVVTRPYFGVVGLPITRGRAFGERDAEGAARVAVVSERVAERLWPGGDPIGRQIRIGGSAEWITVVGVVPNVQLMMSGAKGVDGRAESAVYLPATQATAFFGSVLLARTVDDPLLAAPDVRRAMSEIDPDQSIGRIGRLSDDLGSGATPILWFGVMFATIAAGALVLASIGLYGVIAYSVTRRTREIGVRMALGANAAALRRAVLSQALRLTATGLGIGIAGAWVLVRLMGSFLYGVTSYDPLTYLMVTGLFLLLGAVASAIPARRATRVDPLIALRAQ